MRTKRRLGRKWIWVSLLVAILALLFFNATGSLAWAAEEGAKEGKPMESFFSWFIRCSGFIGFVIFCCSVWLLATIGMQIAQLRQSVSMPPDVLGRCEDMLQQRDFKGIFTAVKDDDSFFSRVLVTGITELPNGLSEAREAMERVGDMITTEMEGFFKIGMMAMLGTLGPMIGLLGTLKGMIASFGVIARSDQGLKPAEVANGISEALLLTFEGVGLALVGIVAFSYFRNRVMTISVSTMTRADEFLRHFAQAARQGGAKPAAAPAAGAAAPARPKV
jgi:biopolymer transport protein ExbB